MSSGLFREFLMIGKREIAAPEMAACTCFNSSCHPTGRIRDYRNSSWVVVLCSAFLADGTGVESHSQHIRIPPEKSLSVSHRCAPKTQTRFAVRERLRVGALKGRPLLKHFGSQSAPQCSY